MTSPPLPNRGALAALALAAGLALAPRVARAQDVAGSLAGHLLIADGDTGGGATLDVWAPIDWLRLGGFVGVGVIPADRDARNRVMMPAGVSVAARWDGGGVAFSLRARGGVWGGATQEAKLTLGGFVGGGATLGWQVSPRVALFVGIEVWGVFGAGESWCVPLSVGLEWGPEAPAPSTAIDDGV